MTLTRYTHMTAWARWSSHTKPGRACGSPRRCAKRNWTTGPRGRGLAAFMLMW